MPWRRNLIFAWLSQFLSMAGFCFGLPFIAYYLQDLGVTDKNQLYIYLGIFNAGAPLMFMISAPVWGQLADKYGRKLMMLRANAAGAVVLFGMGFSEHIAMLLVFRLLQGTFTGTMAAAQTLVAAHTPGNRHGTVLGTLQTASFTGIMAGGFLGGRCADSVGYANSFHIGGAIMLCSTLLIYFGIRETVPAQQTNNPLAKPLPPPALLPRLLPVLLFIAAAAAFRFFGNIVLPLLVQNLNAGAVHGSSTITGDLSALCCLAGILGGLLFGRLADRISTEHLAKVLIAAAAVTLGMHIHIENLPRLFALRFAAAFALIGLDPIVQLWICRLTPPNQRGAAFGWAASFRSIGWIIGPLAGSGIAAALNHTSASDTLTYLVVFWSSGLLLTLLIPITGWTCRSMYQTVPNSNQPHRNLCPQQA